MFSETYKVDYNIDLIESESELDSKIILDSLIKNIIDGNFNMTPIGCNSEYSSYVKIDEESDLKLVKYRLHIILN